MRTYIGLAKAPMNIYGNVVGSSTSLDNLPLLAHDNSKVTGVKDILTYLRKENYGLEYQLSDSDTIKMAALIGNIESCLLPAMKYFLWSEPNVYSMYTRRIYSHDFNWIYGAYRLYQWKSRYTREARYSQLDNCYREATDIKLVRNSVNSYSVLYSCLMH
ncbi:unnamed protein product [Protopolystoma xenopodis]|uniref:Mitochondrial outer membrane transport complex Sam37/metaxin N-terminal domain-containing protein n=1 Tax=Protopolystoma xenopodis TaxID=117903 RepID=A0A448WX67_9PLAT|nr:unnamed protein product [Protopolystoma xenopodis]